MSTETKQLFHSPEDFSDAELDIMRVKLQNQRRIPKIAAGFGLAGAAMFEAVYLRRAPRMMSLLIGASSGYAFGGYGASNLSGDMLARKFDYDIIICNEQAQLRRTMNLAGYSQDYIGRANMRNDEQVVKPY